jgi:hypothetical protein
VAIANDIEHVLGAFSGVAMDATVAVDTKIARLATAQHGVVAARQLLALGVGRRAVQHRIACGP